MIKDIYLMHIDGEIAFYIPSKRCPSYGSIPQDKFIELIEGLREEYPDHRLRCIRNEGLEEHLKNKLSKIKQVMKQGRD
jgi:hypothetical protein